MRAIQEDTEFLAQNAVMDYSLLTCIDDQTGELVVGIIGELRLYWSGVNKMCCKTQSGQLFSKELPCMCNDMYVLYVHVNCCCVCKWLIPY